MAAVEVTISGVLYDKTARTTQPVVLIGEATLTGVGIGGGPVIPPEGGGQPPGGGGGGGGKPTFPIYLPPGSWPPGGQPPSAGGGYPPSVEHPIAPGGRPDKPPEPVSPPIDWKAVWHPEEGWVVVGIPQFPHPSPSEQPQG